MPGLSECLGLARPRLLRQAADDPAYLGQMHRRRATNGTGLRRSEQYVDERATREGLLAKPNIENIEDRQQLPLGIRGAALDLGLEPSARPFRFPLVEDASRCGYALW
jgi:hypothetical protein